MMAESVAPSGHVDFEKLMAESRISDISMQQTVIGVGMKRSNSINSEVECINEVDKLYTKEEMKIAKLAVNIKETQGKMMMGWNIDEVDITKEESKFDLNAGTAIKKKNPQRYGGMSYPSKIKNSMNSRGKKDTNNDVVGSELLNNQYIQGKDEYEDFVDEYYNINKMMVDAKKNLMNFLENPEADEELQDLEQQDEENSEEGLFKKDLHMTPIETRNNSFNKIQSQMALPKNEEDGTFVKPLANYSAPPVKKIQQFKDAKQVNEFPEGLNKDVKKLDKQFYSMGKKEQPNSGRINSISTRFETNRTTNNLVSGRTGVLTKKTIPKKN